MPGGSPLELQRRSGVSPGVEKEDPQKTAYTLRLFRQCGCDRACQRWLRENVATCWEHRRAWSEKAKGDQDIQLFQHLLQDSAPLSSAVAAPRASAASVAVPRAGAASVAVPQAGAASVPLPQSHQRKITRYQVFGRVLCVRAFQRVWGIGSARFWEVRKGSMLGRPGALCGFTVPQEAAGEKSPVLAGGHKLLGRGLRDRSRVSPRECGGRRCPLENDPEGDGVDLHALGLGCRAPGPDRENGTSSWYCEGFCGVPSALGIRLWPAPAGTSTRSSKKTGKTA